MISESLVHKPTETFPYFDPVCILNRCTWWVNICRMTGRPSLC